MFEKCRTVLKRRLSVSALAVTLAVIVSAIVVYAQVGGIFPTVLTAYSASGRVTGSIVVTARLTRFFGGAPIASQRLQPYIVRDGGSSTLGAVYTDNNGYARLTLLRGALPKTGTYYIGWRYDGNGVYSRPLPVSAVTVTP